MNSRDGDGGFKHSVRKSDRGKHDDRKSLGVNLDVRFSGDGLPLVTAVLPFTFSNLDSNRLPCF